MNLEEKVAELEAELEATKKELSGYKLNREILLGQLESEKKRAEAAEARAQRQEELVFSIGEHIRGVGNAK